MARFIAIEGLIGVGKTTLCRLLAQERGATLILEPNEHNPFLGPFYADPERYAFSAQMFYLYQRWKQQQRIRQLDLFDQLVVSDYVFAKDRIFAEKTLSDEELELYDRFAGTLAEQGPRPDLLVFLSSPLDVIMARIAERQAVGEGAIKLDYLIDLQDRYDVLLANWHQCPVLRLSNRELNYRDDPDARDIVLRRIDAALTGNVASQQPPGSQVDREGTLDMFSAKL
ncbi:MAG: deoxyguanosine kinase [Kiritimatiellia bacterium]